MIRGPYLAHPLLMIFNSRAIVASCAGDALLISIVNFFIYPLFLGPLALFCRYLVSVTLQSLKLEIHLQV